MEITQVRIMMNIKIHELNQVYMNHVKRITLLFFTLLTALIIFQVSHIAYAIDERAPEQIVEDTSKEILRVLNEDKDRLKEDPKIVSQLIDDTVIPVIDLNAMGKLILGKYWKQASEQQRNSFITEFKDMLIRTYGKSLADFGGAEVKVLPARGEQKGKYRTVQTELSTGSGKTPLQVAYIFRSNKDSEWKVFDLAVDGLSLVKNFRTSFGQEIKETSLDQLIDRLANTNKEEAVKEAASGS